MAASRAHAIGRCSATEFACGLTVYSHNQLYGRWYVVPKGDRPKTNRQLRWSLETASKTALLYSASDIAILSDDELALHPFLAKVGVGILSDQPTVSELSQYMADAKFRRRVLGSLLLDQSFVARIGSGTSIAKLTIAGRRHISTLPNFERS